MNFVQSIIAARSYCDEKWIILNLNYCLLHLVIVFSVLAPNNKALEPNTYYTVFIRAYVSNDLYTSTEWYPVVVTLREDDKMSK